jgi:two-component system, chemotaxis family, CheB/CheR fusion protein
MAKDKPGSSAGKSAAPPPTASLADRQPAEASDKPDNRSIEIRSSDEPISVVGIGASAGGLKPIQELMAQLPDDSRLSFVIVMHLAPEHESNLAAILQRTTKMPVIQITEETRVRPNHVYVIPPNHHLAMNDGKLVLSEPQQKPGRRVAIDLFFRTLAEHWGQRAVSITLSGGDSDGVIGVKHIKAQGGLAIAQDPGEAEHDSMPRSAIETGMVDWVLPVSAMPAKLVEYVLNEQRMKLPPEDGPTGLESDAEPAPGGATVAKKTGSAEDESALQQVLAFVHVQTGHDFTQYKRATVLRRIARRMQVNSLDSVPAYLNYLRSHADESPALLRDLLIGVTHFFRDQDAFASLEGNVAQLFAGKNEADQVRVWAVGCSTGEEAYTIAILLCEHAANLEHPPSLQIFATDIDESAIAEAREGIYPPTIEADVSQERLRRFFSNYSGDYRVKKGIRELVLFAPHDVLRDPPFSRLDLITCRNLLIYLKPEAQHRVLDIFHFALRPGGLLFLGDSERIDDGHTLFAPIDKKRRIHVRRTVARPAGVTVSIPLSTLPRRPLPQMVLPRSIAPLVLSKATPVRDVEAEASRARSLSELHLELVERYAPPSIIVDENYKIVHLSGGAGRFLHFGGGEPSKNLLKVVLPALRIETRTALFRASQANGNITISGVAVELESKARIIDLHVRPAHDSGSGNDYYLVLFEEKTTSEAVSEAPAPYEETAPHLERELEATRAQLSDTVEQYEASNEELKASNEELQAINEELRSATEELETGREELQSVNEELNTVNQELKTSVEDLARSNNDLQNLIAATDIGTIFLNRELRIKRFTPRAQELFNVLVSDVGRPLSDLTRRVDYASLPSDAERVLLDLIPIEREARHENGQYFLIRIVPYRTAEDKIDGVVLNFVDITRRKEAENDLRAAAQAREEQARLFDITLSSIADFAYTFDREGRFLFANQPLANLLGLTPEAMVGKNFFDLGYPDELAARLQEQIQKVFETKEIVRDETPFTSPAGSSGYYEYIFQPVLNAEGLVESVVGSTRDLTEHKKAGRALAESESRFRGFADNSAAAFWILAAENQKLEYLNPAYENIWGEARDVAMGDPGRWKELVHPDDRSRVGDMLRHLLSGERETIEYRIVRPNDGKVRWIRDAGFPIYNEKGALTRVAGAARDITAEKENENELLSTQQRYRLLVEGAPEYAMFIIGLDNRISYWSPGAERIFGWSAEEAVGQSGNLIFTPDDRAGGREMKEIEIASRDGVASDRRWHLRKDGSQVWVDGVMHRLVDEDGTLRGYAKIARDATERQEAEEKLKESHFNLERRVVKRTADLTATNRKLQAEIERRVKLEQEILQISEREQRRIGQDLHDSLCQELAAAAFFLQSGAKKLSLRHQKESKILTEAAQIVNANVGLARDLARGLHPVELSASGLRNALSELAYRINQNVPCRFDSPRPVRVRDETLALNLYRIAQEALANAVQHGNPKGITISLTRDHQGINLVIHDDGKGMAAAVEHERMGLHIMKYRAAAVGGTLTVRSKPDDGTTITCRVPRS